MANFNVLISIYGNDFINNTWYNFPSFNLNINKKEVDTLCIKKLYTILKEYISMNYIKYIPFNNIYINNEKKILKIFLFYKHLNEEYKAICKLNTFYLYENIKTDILSKRDIS